MEASVAVTPRASNSDCSSRRVGDRVTSLIRRSLVLPTLVGLVAAGFASSISPTATFASSASSAAPSTIVIWTLRPGCAHDIDVGAADFVFLHQTFPVVWVVGCNPVPSGFGIYQWDDSPGSWFPSPGGAFTIAGTLGTESSGVLVTNDVGQIWRASEPAENDLSPWSLLGGCAHDIDAGADGTAWVVGCNPMPGGFGIYQQSPTGLGAGWVTKPGGAVRIGVDPNGDAWVTNNVGQIFHWNGRAWVLAPGCGRDIDVGFDGSVWLVGCNPVPGGFGIYRWSGSGWVRQPGGALRIGVDFNGNAWVTNNLGQVYSSS
jgi:hypothetical protein